MAGGRLAEGTMGHNIQAISATCERDLAGGETIHIHPLKAAFDSATALFALIVLSPLFALIMLAIKIDGWLYSEDQGPALYKEDRVSQGRVFKLCKFRVIKVAAIEAARQEKEYDHVKPLEKGGDSKTRVGHWLQRWYLDELPQLLNVLKGDMSLVGPRPWPVHMYEEEISRGVYRKRLVRPGLTGLVQAHKDEAGAAGNSLALDEAYIEACRTLSPVQLLFFDLRVIVDTFRILAKGEGL